MPDPEFDGSPIRWAGGSGQSWEDYCVRLLGEQYGFAEVQAIPADEGGDYGLDVLVRREGLVVQCYAPVEPLPAQDRYAKQRDKISTDVAKLVSNAEPIGRLLGDVKLRRWMLLTPFFRRSALVAHAQTKASEVGTAGLPFIDPDDFQILIKTDQDFSAGQRERARKGHAVEMSFDNPWGEAVRTCSLWPAETEAETSAFRGAAAHVASLCWHMIAGRPVESRNPWRDVVLLDDRATSTDRDYPMRVLELTAQLAQSLAIRFSPEEACLVTVAPFLHEAAVDAGEWRMAEVTHAYDRPRPAADGTRHWLQHVFDAVLAKRPQLHRKAERLAASSGPVAAAAVIGWLVHEAVAGLAEIWQVGTQSTQLFPDELTSALEDLHRLLPRRGGEALVRPLALARALSADPQSFDDASLKFPREEPFRSGAQPVRAIRVQLLARLLALTGLMACDPRRIGRVVVDHIGLSDGTSPREFILQTRETFWEPEMTDWTFHARDILHPAYDLAFGLMLERLRGFWAATRAAVEANPAGIDALRALPAFRARLEPKLAGGAAVYQTPHVRFELATDEVKELLMGDRLYHDPMVAVRELYQNALDACRHREARIKARAAEEAVRGGDGAGAMRERYRSAMRAALSPWQAARPRDGAPEPTDALIRFRQYDSGGRLIIECSDDGVGMGRRELEECFARAGRRFSDTDEFVIERARWRDLETRLGLNTGDDDASERIDFTPNSQFGIGVFSYFMLAEEIEVVTRRFHPDGRQGETLVARISGSGSLFRISKADHDRESCGTTVRLSLDRRTYRKKVHYSDERVEIRIDCVAWLRRMLWVAEYPTETRSDRGRRMRWEKDVFYVPKRVREKRRLTSRPRPVHSRGTVVDAHCASRIVECPCRRHAHADQAGPRHLRQL